MMINGPFTKFDCCVKKSNDQTWEDFNLWRRMNVSIKKICLRIKCLLCSLLQILRVELISERLALALPVHVADDDLHLRVTCHPPFLISLVSAIEIKWILYP